MPEFSDHQVRENYGSNLIPIFYSFRLFWVSWTCVFVSFSRQKNRFLSVHHASFPDHSSILHFSDAQRHEKASIWPPQMCMCMTCYRHLTIKESIGFIVETLKFWTSVIRHVWRTLQSHSNFLLLFAQKPVNLWEFLNRELRAPISSARQKWLSSL